MRSIAARRTRTGAKHTVVCCVKGRVERRLNIRKESEMGVRYLFDPF